MDTSDGLGALRMVGIGTATLTRSADAAVAQSFAFFVRFNLSHSVPLKQLQGIAARCALALSERAQKEKAQSQLEGYECHCTAMTVSPSWYRCAEQQQY